MTSAGPSRGRMLPGDLGNKGEPPPPAPQQRRGQGHEAGGGCRLAPRLCGMSGSHCSCGDLGIDTREDFPTYSLGGYVTGRRFRSSPVNGTSFFSKKVEEVLLEESTLAFLDFIFHLCVGIITGPSHTAALRVK